MWIEAPNGLDSDECTEYLGWRLPSGRVTPSVKAWDLNINLHVNGQTEHRPPERGRISLIRSHAIWPSSCYYGVRTVLITNSSPAQSSVGKKKKKKKKKRVAD